MYKEPEEPVLVGETPEGYQIFRWPNKDIGGWDYVSTSCGMDHTIVNAMVDIEELKIVLADLEMMAKRAELLAKNKP